jgi:glutaminyl-tRNA synthetase
VIRCDEVIRNDAGDIVELRCSYDPATLGANPEGRKVKGVIHWVSASHGMPAEIRLYDRLFTVPNPGAAKDRDWREDLNPESLVVVHGVVEPALADAPAGSRFQFEREGYFCVDSRDGAPGRLVFNRTITLRDTWAKLSAQA